MMKCLFTGLALLWLLMPQTALAQTVASPGPSAESGRVICASAPCQTYGGQVNNTSAASLWVMMFDASSVPANGTVTGCLNGAASRPCILKWYQMGANSTIGISELYTTQPYPVLAGLSLVCSSTGPFTLTATSTCVFSWEAQK